MATIDYVAPDGSTRTTPDITIDEPPSPHPELPVVLLLHGNNGTVDDMTDPAAHPGMNYAWQAPLPVLVDRGWHPYPNTGLWGVGLDPTMPVTGWQPALRDRGFPTVNYGQIDNAGPLAAAVSELRAVLRILPAGRKIAVLAHSRGGLLIRKLLVDYVDDPELSNRIIMVITLHSPHQGTELASRATELTAALAGLRTTYPVTIPITDLLYNEVRAPSYQEFRVGSPFLQELEAAEAAAPPPMPFHTFGGTNSTLGRVVSWLFTPESALPQVSPNGIGFHWSTVPAMGPALFSDLPPLSPELVMGQGDILVADARTHLPYEQSHQTNPLNHGEALWDPQLQDQVAALLASTLNPMPPPPRSIRVTIEPPRQPLDTPVQVVVRASDDLTGDPVTGDVILDGTRVAGTGQPFTYTFHKTSTRVFDPDTKTWSVEVDWSTGEVTAPTYPPTAIPLDLYTPAPPQPLTVAITPARVIVGHPETLTVTATDPTTGQPAAGTVHVNDTTIGPTGTPFQYTFTDTTTQLWVTAPDRPRARVPLVIAPHGQLKITVEPARQPANTPVQVVVRASDDLTGDPVTGDVILDGIRVAATNTPFTTTLKRVTTRTFDPDTKKWEIDVTLTTGEVRAPTYTPAPIPLNF